VTAMPRPEIPPTEVLPKAQRRTFSARYKARILTEAEACKPGELAAMLRREGLYSSHLATWRADRKAGGLKALAPAKPGPKPAPRPRTSERTRALERELAQTRRKLARAELLLTIQKKPADLLTLELLPAPGEES
jgi:transposase